MIPEMYLPLHVGGGVVIHTVKALCFAAAALVAVPASAATTWVVDQDGQATASNCTGTALAFTSITIALTAAAPGDKILVCPGTGPYNEQLAITKTVTVKGFPQTRVVIAPAPMSANTSNLFSGRRLPLRS